MIVLDNSALKRINASITRWSEGIPPTIREQREVVKHSNDQLAALFVKLDQQVNLNSDVLG